MNFQTAHIDYCRTKSLSTTKFLTENHTNKFRASHKFSGAKFLLAAVLSSAFFSACAQHHESPETSRAKNLVKVIKRDLFVERGGFVEKKNIRSGHGVTEWMFHCYPDFTFTKQTAAGYPRRKVTLTVAEVTMTISCPIKMRLGGNIEKKIVEHEEGHLEIIKEVYAKAGQAATDACQTLIGMRFEGEGETEDDAINQATDKASRKLCSLYTNRTVRVVNELSKKYDEITQHGAAAVAVADAIKQSWETIDRPGSQAKP